MIQDLWDQINKLDQFKDGNYVKDRLRNSLRSFTYNYLDLDLQQFHIDNKRISILRSLNAKFAILKPGKGNGIVILKRSDYIDSLNSPLMIQLNSNVFHMTFYFTGLLTQAFKPGSSNIGADRAFFLRGREGAGGGAHILRGRTLIRISCPDWSNSVRTPVTYAIASL